MTDFSEIDWNKLDGAIREESLYWIGRARTWRSANPSAPVARVKLWMSVNAYAAQVRGRSAGMRVSASEAETNIQSAIQSAGEELAEDSKLALLALQRYASREREREDAHRLLLAQERPSILGRPMR